jgi:hypothetical protein
MKSTLLGYTWQGAYANNGICNSETAASSAAELHSY